MALQNSPCRNGHMSIRYADGRCKVCANAASAKWYANNIEVARIARKKWRMDNVDLAATLSKEWYTRNIVRRNAKSREWYTHNKCRRAMVAKAFRSANRALYKLIAHRRRGAKGRYTKDDISVLWDKQEGRCAAAHCRTPLDNFHIDHKNPISRGGSNYPRNLQLLCAPCNINKGARTMREWNRARAKYTVSPRTPHHGNSAKMVNCMDHNEGHSVQS